MLEHPLGALGMDGEAGVARSVEPVLRVRYAVISRPLPPLGVTCSSEPPK
jgi:hypothetical protein